LRGGLDVRDLLACGRFGHFLRNRRGLGLRYEFHKLGPRLRHRPWAEFRHEGTETVGSDRACGIARPSANHAVRDLAAYVRRLSAHPHPAADLITFQLKTVKLLNLLK
jgi:hypothetical protein